MSIHDWLPRNHEALYNQATQTMDYLTASGNLVRMGFGADTPQGEWLVNTFDVAYTAFITAYTAWSNPAQRTTAKTASLVAAEKMFNPLYRQLYTGFLKVSPLVTDSDLVSMGLPQRNDDKPTPAPVPATVPVTEIVLPAPATVEIHFHDEGKTNVAKPKGVHGAEICWAIRDTPPGHWNDLTKSSFDTHTPLRLEFDIEERGRTLYFAIRWENTRGEKGPWSEIQTAVIP